MRLLSIVAVFVVYSNAFAQEPVFKAAIPDEAAQKVALAVIADVYKPDYEKAKTPPQKIELAKTLLREGEATQDDSVARFVLFRIARDIAAQQGDLLTGLNTVNRIAGEFEIDRLQMQVDVATAAVKAPKLAKDHQACAALLTPLIDEAIAVDRYEQAKSLAELTLVCAREGKEPDRVKQTVAKAKEIDEIAVEFAKVKEAQVELETKPTDPDANFAVGRYHCFIKGDWKRGVTMLAFGSNEGFKAAAIMELEEKPDSLKLGDTWWKVAESLEGTPKSRAQIHAAEWYRKALPGLSGLTKTRVERLVESSESAPSNADSTATAKPTAKKEIDLLERDSLKGWTTIEAVSTPNWIVKDGELIYVAKGPSLVTKQKFNDFDLHLEFLLPPLGNTGIFLRGRYEVQLIDSAVRLRGQPVPLLNACGSIVGQIAPSRVVYRGPDKWNECDVRLVGRTVSVRINDTLIIDRQTISKTTAQTLDENENQPGGIMLQGNYPITGIRFRNVVISPIE